MVCISSSLDSQAIRPTDRNLTMIKLCYVATIPAVVNSFLREHIRAASDRYQITVICNSVDKYLLDGINARLIFLPIERKPSPWRDFLVLLLLCKIFKQERFDIVHSHMPKTGFLAMLAAWFVGIPIRINTFHGEVWATRTGWRRAVLKLFDKSVGKLATDIQTVSLSQCDFLVKERVFQAGKAKLIGAGSICGVDVNRFHPDLAIRRSTRDALGISQDATIILYVGRLTRDKGILDLVDAFNLLVDAKPNMVLLMVGSEEDVTVNHIQKIFKAIPRNLRYVSFTATPEGYMMAADIFCLPSYREGFGMTIIESAACGIPGVASRIYGITDAVEDGKTGLLFPAGDVAALARSLLTLIMNEEYRRKMGEVARLRALELFSSELITHEMAAFYEELISRHNDEVGKFSH
jgi:glycosyltransferase involved in cell wall biosynthesis